MGERLALHQALGQRTNVTVEHGHLFVGHAPTADKRGLVERKLLDRLLIGAKVLVRTLVLGIAKQLGIIHNGHPLRPMDRRQRAMDHEAGTEIAQQEPPPLA